MKLLKFKTVPLLILLLLATINIQQFDTLSSNTKIIAHRGYSTLAPENTLPAFIKAGKSGFWGVECDVYETSDSNFVIMHDSTVDRTTNGTGSIKDMTLEKIKKLSIDVGSNISKYPKLKVPTLQEYLEVCKKYNLHPIIEVKDLSRIDLFLDIINSYDFIDNCTIISFNLSTLEKIRSINNTIDIQALLDLTTDNINYCKKHKFNMDVPYKQISKNLIENAHNEGIKVNTWTINERNSFKQAISYEVDFITTDSIIQCN